MRDIEKQKEAKRRHYEANKEDYKARSLARHRAKRQIVRDLKESSPCTDCGEFYPFYVMQYDHVNDDKTANVNRVLKTAGWQKVLDEIAKCELVCANCHASRTWKRHGIE